MRAFRHLLDLWEGFSTPFGPLGRPSDPYLTYGRNTRPFPDLREGLTNLWESFPTPSGPLGGTPAHSQTSEGNPGRPGVTPDPSWTSGRVFRPLLTPLRPLEGPSGPLEVTPDPSRTCGRDTRSLLDLRVRHPTPPRPSGGAFQTSGRASRTSEVTHTPPGPPGATPDPYRTFGRASQTSGSDSRRLLDL